MSTLRKVTVSKEECMISGSSPLGLVRGKVPAMYDFEVASTYYDGYKDETVFMLAVWRVESPQWKTRKKWKQRNRKNWR